jgi:Sulfotransferase family
VAGAVEIEEVSLARPEPSLVRGFSLSSPSTGASGHGPYSLELRGWALGARVPVVAIEVMDQSRFLWRIPLTLRTREALDAHPDADASRPSGFVAAVSALKLPLIFGMSVLAVLEDDRRVELATLRGRRPALATGFEPTIRPLMVTSVPRVGSTIFLRMLGLHPSIAVYPPFEHESRVASYWLELLRALAEPASYLRQVAPPRDFPPNWWLGDKPPLVWRLRCGEDVADWMGSAGVEALAGFCQARIDAVSSRIAREQGKPQAAYFAEKFQVGPLPNLAWELYPDAREIMMVRDFRDVACSIFARRERRGDPMSEGERASYLRENLGERVSKFMRGWRQRSDRAHLVRYEDLILEPRETLRRVFTQLELEIGDAELDQMLERSGEVLPQMRLHRTTPEAKDSVGRWRRDLGDDLQQVALEALGPTLEELGYPAK